VSRAWRPTIAPARSFALGAAIAIAVALSLTPLRSALAQEEPAPQEEPAQGDPSEENLSSEEEDEISSSDEQNIEDNSASETEAETEAETTEEEIEDAEEGESERDAEEGESEGDARIRYLLERVVIRGNEKTTPDAIRVHLPFRRGDILDVDDQRIELARFRLLGTGWFRAVSFHLERGAERGHVILVVEVREQNTFVVRQVAFGVSVGQPEAEPYLGFSLAESNLFGIGLNAELQSVLSLPQQGVRLRMGHGNVDGSNVALSGVFFFNNGREFFGDQRVLVATTRCDTDDPEEICEEVNNAIVRYRRYGMGFGGGYDVGGLTRLTLDYQLEIIETLGRPAAASETRGIEVRPIDFSIQDGTSFVSALQVGLIHDARDNPALTMSGRLVQLRADLSGTVLGSSYDFVRFQGVYREWIPLPGFEPGIEHSLRLGLFVGAGFGDMPFFYKFYSADLSDLIPSRYLELNLDRRAPPNLLGTSIVEMRAQQLAARIDIEYGMRVYHGEGHFRTLLIYANLGLYSLLDHADLEVAVPGYSGFSAVPLDLTFDLGLRMDTSIGVFQLGFSNLLGFFSLL
jgi:hypothetical protein